MRANAMIFLSVSLVLAWATLAVAQFGIGRHSNAGFFRSNFTIPRITVGEPANITYSIDESINQQPELVLCQTNATGTANTDLTAENSWTVSQIDSMCNYYNIPK